MYCISCEVRTEFICYVEEGRPTLCSSGQSSMLQIQRPRFDSWRYQIFWEVLGLERVTLSLVSKFFLEIPFYLHSVPVHSASSVRRQLRNYLVEKVAAPDNRLHSTVLSGWEKSGSEQFWISLRITVFLDVFRLPEFWILGNKTFQETGCVSVHRWGEGDTYSVGYLRTI
jgi:hypothetical protein